MVVIPQVCKRWRDVCKRALLSQADFTALLGKCPPIMDGALTADLFSVYDQKGEKTISINELKAQLGEAISKGQVTEAEVPDHP